MNKISSLSGRLWQLEIVPHHSTVHDAKGHDQGHHARS